MILSAGMSVRVEPPAGARPRAAVAETTGAEKAGVTAQDPGFAFERIGVGRGFERVVGSLRGGSCGATSLRSAAARRSPTSRTSSGVSRPMSREALKAL